MIVVTAPLAGRYASTHGSRIPMTYGLILAGSGLLILSRLSLDTSYWLMLPVFVIMGHGMAATMSPMTAAVMNSVGPQRAGLGSAMTNTSREVGGVFGIALLGTILTTKLKSSITPALIGLGVTAQQREVIVASAGHGQFEPGLLRGLGLSPGQIAGAFHAFAQSFLDGFQIALVVAGSVLLLAALIANRFIPSGAPAREEVHAGEAPVPVPAEI
jgi:MFS family permease